MKSVSTQEAKAHLSSLLKAAERGEEIVVSRHGRPVAKIVPYSADRPRTRDEGMARRLAGFKMTPAEIEAALAPMSDEELADWGLD